MFFTGSSLSPLSVTTVQSIKSTTDNYFIRLSLTLVDFIKSAITVYTMRFITTMYNIMTCHCGLHHVCLHCVHMSITSMCSIISVIIVGNSNFAAIVYIFKSYHHNVQKHVCYDSGQQSSVITVYTVRSVTSMYRNMSFIIVGNINSEVTVYAVKSITKVYSIMSFIIVNIIMSVITGYEV